MIRHKTYKYRLYPTKKQQILLSKHFGCCRFVYNYALSRKIEEYVKNKITLSCFDLSKEITELKKKEDTEWLKEVSAQSLQSSLAHLDTAYKNFFREKKSFPKFKSKKSKQSCEFKQNTHVHFDINKLRVLKFQEGIKCKFDRTFDGKIKKATIKRVPSGKYFVSILVEEEVEEIKKYPLDINKAVGIDVGIKTFAVVSNGKEYNNPKYLKSSMDKLKKTQRNLSKKKKDSNNFRKQKKKVALMYEKITNQRKDFLHKVSRELVNDNQITTYCLEDLNISGMMKNHNLAGSISDAGWYTFKQYLKYKSEWAGKNILEIGRFEPSSKTCNACGKINHKLTLKDRKWTCECGVEHDRDFLASCNIRDFAFNKQNIVGQGMSELKLVEAI